VLTTPVAIVTGAARGIGKACADALSEAGFHLVCNDVLPFEADAHRSFCHVADIGDPSTHAGLVQAALDRWGRIDCLVNNAGVGAIQRGDLLDVSLESYDRCQSVNTRGLFFLTQAVARQMLRANPDAGFRSIINITSSNAVAASITRGEYCVSKSASSMVTRLFALRLAGNGIGVYEIRPGLIETEMTRPVKKQYDERLPSLVPDHRWGQPADVAAIVRLLAEGRMPYSTGEAIAVDGGMTILRY
jgi:3-oxoacyl-[acyl-carrier protein] reductase